MKYILLLAVPLLLSSELAYAEWVAITKPQAEPSKYVDSDTIRRKGNVVKWWQLVDYKTVQTMGGTSFLSAKIQMEFDCAEEQIRVLALSQFSGNMGSGEVVFSNFTKDEWEPVQPGSRGHTLWKVACRK
jgi:hypothetical protein